MLRITNHNAPSPNGKARVFGTRMCRFESDRGCLTVERVGIMGVWLVSGILGLFVGFLVFLLLTTPISPAVNLSVIFQIIQALGLAVLIIISLYNGDCILR